MKVVCESCQAKYQVPDERLTAGVEIDLEEVLEEGDDDE